MIKTETKRYINYELCANNYIVHCKAQCQNKINVFQPFLSYVERSTKSFSKGPMQWHEPRARGHGMSRSCNHA